MARVKRRASQDLTFKMGVASLRAKQEADKRGLPVPNRPAHEQPEMPEDITDVGDDELMSLMMRLTGWANYLAAQLAMARVDEQYADAVLKKYEAFSAIANKMEKSVTTAKALAYEDSDFLEAKEEYEQCFAYRKLVEMMYESIDRNNFAVSRELTRRLGRSDRDNRSAKWNT
jgi:hypothetical protein